MAKTQHATKQQSMVLMITLRSHGKILPVIIHLLTQDTSPESHGLVADQIITKAVADVSLPQTKRGLQFSDA